MANFEPFMGGELFYKRIKKRKPHLTIQNHIQIRELREIEN